MGTGGRAEAAMDPFEVLSSGKGWLWRPLCPIQKCMLGKGRFGGQALLSLTGLLVCFFRTEPLECIIPEQDLIASSHKCKTRSLISVSS